MQPINPAVSQVIGSRADILTAINSSRSVANKKDSITIPVPMGQYWYPTFIKVSAGGVPTTIALGNNLPPVNSPCTVYAGAQGDLSPTGYLDDTIFGVNDTSSICSGMMFQFGTAITAVWDICPPGVIHTLTVYGVTSNIPLSYGSLFPIAPGTHFTGHRQARGLTQYFETTFISSTQLDMSPFQSFGLMVTAPQIVGTSFNILQTNVTWADVIPSTNVDNPNTSQVIYGRSYQHCVSQTAAGFTSFGGTLVVHDNVHGTLMTVAVANTGGDSVPITVHVAGYSEPIGVPYVMDQVPDFQDNPSQDEVLISDASTLAAAASINRCAKMNAGYWRVLLAAGSQPYTFTYQYGNDANSSESFTVAANSSTAVERIAPSQPVIWNAKNTGTLNGSYRIHMVGNTTKTG